MNDTGGRELVAGDDNVPGEVERALNVGAIMTVSVNHNQIYEIFIYIRVSLNIIRHQSQERFSNDDL